MTLALACCPFLAGQTLAPIGHTPVAASETTPPSGSSLVLPDYIISPDDVLNINVYEAPDVTGDYRVSPAGQIVLPLLNAPIVAAGRTPGELADLISAKYRESEIYSRSRVTVSIKESRVHAVTIAGAVKHPQIYPVFGKTTLVDLLSQAEGLADNAGTLAIITRGQIATQILKQSDACAAGSNPASCEGTFTVNLNKLTESGDPLLNVDLYPGDRVTVQRAGIIYVVGAVNRPGGFPLKTGQEDMTVLQAVALAEDLKPTAIRDKAMILRKNPSAQNGRDEIPVDLKKVLAGSVHDTQLQAEDVFFVPDSTGKKAFRRGIEAAIQSATFAVVYVH
jgi:polysaccharide export outer membrane protein